MPDNSIAILRLESGEPRSTQYIDHIKMDVATEKIIDPLKQRYTELGAAQSFVDTIHLEDGGEGRVILVIDHPIAAWLEYGTQAHWIEAKDAPYLKFQYRKTSAWFDSHANDSGDWVETFIVDHPGFPGYRLLAILLNTLTQSYARELVRRTNQWLEESRIY